MPAHRSTDCQAHHLSVDGKVTWVFSKPHSWKRSLTAPGDDSFTPLTGKVWASASPLGRELANRQAYFTRVDGVLITALREPIFSCFLSSSEGKYKELEPVSERGAGNSQQRGWSARPSLGRRRTPLRPGRSFWTRWQRAVAPGWSLLSTPPGWSRRPWVLLGIRSVVKRGIAVLNMRQGFHALRSQSDVPLDVRDANIVAHSEEQSKPPPVRTFWLVAFNTHFANFPDLGSVPKI